MRFLRAWKWCILPLLFLLQAKAIGDFGAAAPDEYTAGVKPINRTLSNSRLRLMSEQYPFLNLDDNHLLINESQPDAFNLVFEKLRDAIFEGEGTLSILHMGGSHVQAGMIGHRIRENFNDLARGVVSSRGLITPFRVGNTNSSVFTSSRSTGDWEGCRCSSSKDRCNWGMTGFNLITESNGATLDTWALKQDSTHYRGREVRLYYDISSATLTPFWNRSQKADSSKVNREQGFKSWYFSQPIDTLSFVFRNDSLRSGRIEVQGTWLGNATSGIVYNEIGVNSASTRSFLKIEQFGRQLKSIKPDIVLFGIGVNDAHVKTSSFNPEAFKDRYDSLISQIKQANPEVRFIFFSNSDNYYRGRPNRNGEVVQKAMFELAEKHNGAVWDLFHVMGGEGSISLWNKAGIAQRDMVHFNRNGYYLLADLFYLAMINRFSDWHFIESNPKSGKPSGKSKER